VSGPASEPIRISLALQGGGAHGAFTWGALDRLSEDEGIEVAAISAASAGALNAAAFKAGLCKGGRAGARAELARFWSGVGAVTDPVLSAWIDAASPSTRALAELVEASPAYRALDAATRVVSPYVLGPMLKSPLARLVERLDFAALRSPTGPQLHVCATNVRTGRIRVFQKEELTPGALMASACLPMLFQAVEIEDPGTGRTEAYWDGGYTGNPALWPLFPAELPRDILIVSLNPFRRSDVPRDALDIANRINEISFNASLLGELRAIAFVRRLIEGGTVPRGAMKDVNVHMVRDDDLMDDLNMATKTLPVPAILARLRQAGRAAMDGFLARHRGDLGARGTLDLAAMLA
jgi:NTE family protein